MASPTNLAEARAALLKEQAELLREIDTLQSQLNRREEDEKVAPAGRKKEPGVFDPTRPCLYVLRVDTMGFCKLDLEQLEAAFRVGTLEVTARVLEGQTGVVLTHVVERDDFREKHGIAYRNFLREKHTARENVEQQQQALLQELEQSGEPKNTAEFFESLRISAGLQKQQSLLVQHEAETWVDTLSLPLDTPTSWHEMLFLWTKVQQQSSPIQVTRETKTTEVALITVPEQIQGAPVYFLTRKGEVWSWAPVTEEFAKISVLPRAITGCTFTRVGSKIYLIGGVWAEKNRAPTVQDEDFCTNKYGQDENQNVLEFDTTTHRWRLALRGDFEDRIKDHCAMLVGNEICAFGNSLGHATRLTFNVFTNMFTSDRTERYRLEIGTDGACSCVNNVAIVTAGDRGTNADILWHISKGNTIHGVGPAVRGHTMFKVGNSLFVAGGHQKGIAKTHVSRSNEVLTNFTKCAEGNHMVHPRSHFQVVRTGADTFCAIGGDLSGTIEELNTTTMTWSLKCPLPPECGSHVLAVSNQQ